MRRRRIGIFGGTFDPPHVGHLAAAAEVRHAAGLDDVLVMVAGDPWQKSGTREVTPAAARLAMVAACLAGHDGLRVSALEVHRPGATYAIDTVEALRAGAEGVGPDDELVLVVGDDVVPRLPTWHRADELAALVSVVAATRPGTSPSDPPPGWSVSRVPVTPVDVSSTELRERLATGRPVDFLVPDGARSVMADLGLYGGRR